MTNQNNISFEAVIKGLECCQACDGYTCRNCCPYHDRNEPEDQPTCTCRLAHDALALLKAQEPRVMTLEELGKLQEDDVVYVEIKSVLDIDITCISVEIIRFVKEVQDPVAWIELHTTDSIGFFETRKSIEPNWRCWTAYPTDAQMKAVKWK